MRKKIRNIVFAVLVIGCILTSNLNLITAYALDDTSEADIRTFLFDMTYEGTRVEGTTIEVFEMNFASNDSVDKKYIKIAEGNNVVSCTLDLTRLTDENKILYVRYTLPEQYEFTRVEVDENNNPTDIPSDYELYWLDDLKASFPIQILRKKQSRIHRTRRIRQTCRIPRMNRQRRMNRQPRMNRQHRMRRMNQAHRIHQMHRILRMIQRGQR